MNCRFLNLLAVIFTLSAATGSAQEVAYNPIVVSGPNGVITLGLSFRDQERQRDISVLIYLPAEKTPAPAVFFSHGLGGSREGSAFLGRHWAARGYVCVFLQHPGSDESVWKDVPPAKRPAAMRQAADARNFLLRVKDVSAVLEQVDLWNRSDGHVLSGRIDMSRVGMSGHSFGAVTTQAVSGQSFGQGRVSLSDVRIKAAVIFSPSSPRRG